MKNLRQVHGALSFESLEARPVFDGDELRELRAEKPNRGKDLIADFMIAANGVTARYLAARKFPSLRRVVRTPKRWDRIVELARQRGFDLPDQPDPKPLEEFLMKQRAADPLRFPDLSLSIIKLMGPGEYVADCPDDASPPGHFGLAVKDYTHSTAPNRRYSDIITQRLLKAALAEQAVPYGKDDLEALAKHSPKRRMRPRRSSGRWENRRRRCCWSRESESSSTPSSPVQPTKARGFACSIRPSRDGWYVVMKVLTWGSNFA